MDLHDMLERSRIPSPYVLVGHSLGGAVVFLFASMYPDEVAGLVLVDPEDGRLVEQLKTRLSAGIWADREKALAQAIPNLPEAARKELAASKSTGEQVDSALPLPAVPIIILTGTLKDPGFPGNPLEQDLKLELHRQFVARTPGSEQVLVRGRGTISRPMRLTRWFTRSWRCSGGCPGSFTPCFPTGQRSSLRHRGAAWVRFLLEN